MTETVAEQTGQTCEADGVGVKSEQKWNCVAKNTAANSKMGKHDWRLRNGIWVGETELR